MNDLHKSVICGKLNIIYLKLCGDNFTKLTFLRWNIMCGFVIKLKNHTRNKITKQKTGRLRGKKWSKGGGGRFYDNLLRQPNLSTKSCFHFWGTSVCAWRSLRSIKGRLGIFITASVASRFWGSLTALWGNPIVWGSINSIRGNLKF